MERLSAADLEPKRRSGDRGVAVVIRIDAPSRVAALESARAQVEALVGSELIESVQGQNDGLEEQDILRWLHSTRRQLRRWEYVFVEEVAAVVQNGNPGWTINWAIETERHLTLISANHLHRALKAAEGRFGGLPENWGEEIPVLRSMHEHGDEQREALPKWAEVPLTKSAKKYAERYPGHSPYGAVGWSDGPELGPGIGSNAFNRFLDDLEARVIEAAPRWAETRQVGLPPPPWAGVSQPGAPGKDRAG